MSGEKQVIAFMIVAAIAGVAGGFAIDSGYIVTGSVLFLIALISISIAHAIAKAATPTHRKGE